MGVTNRLASTVRCAAQPEWGWPQQACQTGVPKIQTQACRTVGLGSDPGVPNSPGVPHYPDYGLPQGVPCRTT